MSVFIRNHFLMGLKLIILPLVVFLLTACSSTPVKKVNLHSLLNGTFVYSGPVDTDSSLTVTLKLNSSGKTFSYSESGGMTNHNYSGSFVILGDKVVFTNTKKDTSKHKVTGTMNGFKLNCIENIRTLSFRMQPLSGNTLEFFKQ